VAVCPHFSPPNDTCPEIVEFLKRAVKQQQHPDGSDVFVTPRSHLTSSEVTDDSRTPPFLTWSEVDSDNDDDDDGSHGLRA